jgi:hypothetical protein
MAVQLEQRLGLVEQLAQRNNRDPRRRWGRGGDATRVDLGDPNRRRDLVAAREKELPPLAVAWSRLDSTRALLAQPRLDVLVDCAPDAPSARVGLDADPEPAGTRLIDARRRPGHHAAVAFAEDPLGRRRSLAFQERPHARGRRQRVGVHEAPELDDPFCVSGPSPPDQDASDVKHALTLDAALMAHDA